MTSRLLASFRSLHAACVAGAALSLLCAAVHAPAQYTPSGTSQAWGAYNTDFYTTDSSGNHIFANQQGGTAITGFWEESNEIAVAVDAYYWAVHNDSTNLPSYVAQINSLCAGFTDHNGHSWSSDSFNDDLDWATITFARAYQVTGTASQLADAETNFNTVWTRGQSPGGAGNGAGGLIQSQPPNTPNLDSPVNFTFVIAGYLIYQITGTASYKTEADSVYAWAMANLYQPTIDGGVCNNHPTLTCSKIYDANSTSVGGSTGPADYTYNYGIAIEAIILEGNDTVAQNVANWLMFNSNNTNYPYAGTYTLNGTAYEVLPNYVQSGLNGAGYNGIAMRGIGFGLAQGVLNAATLAWAQANASAAYSIRNAAGLSWNNWVSTTPATGLYSWDDSVSMAALFDVPSSSIVVTATATANTAQSVPFTATVTPAVATTAATGTVQFYVGGTAVGSPVALVNNAATVNYTFPAAGNATVTAMYSGNSNYTASISQPASVTVSPAPSFNVAAANTSMTLIAGATSGNTDSITITSTNAFAGSVALSCTLTTVTGASGPSCAVAPSPVTLAANGTATSTLTISAPAGATGTYSVSVTGNGGGTTITAAAVAVTVVPVPAVSVTPASSSLTFASGAFTGNTDSIALASVNNYAGNVALACSMSSSSAAYQPSCTISPTPATLSAGGTATATVTIQSATPVSYAKTTTQASNSSRHPWESGGAMLAGILLCVPMKRKRRLGWLPQLCLAFVMLGAISGCSGGGTSISGPSKTYSSAGTYTVTVTATPSGISTAPTATFTVTIQ